MIDWIKNTKRRLGNSFRRFYSSDHELLLEEETTPMSRKRGRLLEDIPETQRRNKRTQSQPSAEIINMPNLKGGPTNTAPLTAKTENQRHYLSAMKHATITVGLGPAGVGKTFMVGTLGADMLKNNEIERLIITRPVVPAGPTLGFLKGDFDEKYEPFIRPFKEVLIERLGEGTYTGYAKSGRIVPLSLEHLRGSTFKRSLVVLDEAQNTTPDQMKMFLTRVGEGSRVVINGDIEQTDLIGLTGLEDAVRRLSEISGISIVEFTEDDIVRHGIIKDILKAYRKKF